MGGHLIQERPFRISPNHLIGNAGKTSFLLVHNCKGVGFQPLVAIFSSTCFSPTLLVCDAVIRELADIQIETEANKDEIEIEIEQTLWWHHLKSNKDWKQIHPYVWQFYETIYFYFYPKQIKFGFCHIYLIYKIVFLIWCMHLVSLIKYIVESMCVKYVPLFFKDVNDKKLYLSKYQCILWHSSPFSWPVRIL